MSGTDTGTSTSEVPYKAPKIIAEGGLPENWSFSEGEELDPRPLDEFR